MWIPPSPSALAGEAETPTFSGVKLVPAEPAASTIRLHPPAEWGGRQGTGNLPRLTGAWGSGWDPKACLLSSLPPPSCWGKRGGKEPAR